MLTSRRRQVVPLFVSVLMGLGTLMALGLSPSRNDPFHAPSIDNQFHSVAENSDTWFKFDYNVSATARSLITVSLVNGAHSGVRFQVWAPDIVGNWWEQKPTGQGTVAFFNCATGQDGGGGCSSNDLTWASALSGSGTFYVRVINDNAFPSSFLLVVQGVGVSSGPPVGATVSPTEAGAAIVMTPAPTAIAGPVTADDPSQAVFIDGQLHSLPGGAVTWYKFNYGGPDAATRPVASLRLVNGVVTGVRFEVWAPENIGEWQAKNPVGRGTQEVVVNCHPTVEETTTDETSDQPTPTPQPPSGDHCPTNDFTWSGAFGEPGIYHVRVVNENSSPMEYVLSVQSTGN